MGIEKTHGRNYDLSRLLEAIRQGKIVLPEFQRDFLWDTKDVEALIATCLSGWPIGSLLLLPGRADLFFRVRGFDSGPEPAEPIQVVVLDGQQRLTSLYQSLYGLGDFRYGVSLASLREGQSIEDLEDAIVSKSASRWQRDYPTARHEYEANIVPVSVLRQASDFYAWRDEAAEGAPAEEKRRLTDIYVESLSGLDRYEVPAVVIDDEVHPEAVARIFERVNRLGRPLATFDLMVAKSFAEDFNLRDEWDLVQEREEQLVEYLPDGGLSILNVIALQVRSSIRQADVLKLQGGDVRKYWSRAVEALRIAVTYLREQLHVRNRDWLPSKVQLTVLGTLAMNDALYGNEPIVNAWFWSSTFQGRYDVASNTRAVEDFTQLLKRVPVAPKEIVLDSETMFSVNRRQYGTLHRGLLCVYASNKPLDPFDPLTRVDEDADLASAVSFIPRTEKVWDMPGHLLTLGMVLTTSRVPRTGGYVSLDSMTEEMGRSQFVPSNPAELTVDEIFAARLRLVAEAISTLSGAETKILTIDDEAAAEQSAI